MSPRLSALATLILTMSSVTAMAQLPVSKRAKMSEAKLLEIISTNQVKDLDQVPALLPKSFRSNFTLKHGLMMDEKGREIHGPRGHLAEGDIVGLGQHSEPLSPRAFLFDPYTGFGISYNGGTTSAHQSQEGGNSLDTISFDPQTKTFRLVKLDFPLAQAGKATPNNQNCTLCHGPMNRPVFSMYPDWPRFYGSDNDELRFGQAPRTSKDANPDFRNADSMSLLRRDLQVREYKWFHQFRKDVVPTHPRYTPLFARDAYEVHGFSEGNNTYTEYPYRSDVEQPGKNLVASDVSRAFTRRAGLRFNLLYSRLFVQQVVEKIKTHPNFEKFGRFFVYNTMRCGPETKNSTTVLNKWAPTIQSTLSAVEQNKSIAYQKWDPTNADASQRMTTVGYFKLPNGKLSLREGGSLLEYGQNLALFGLKINDVDMRFTYHHDAYKPENAFRDLCKESKSKDCSDQVMHVGYLQKSYFNAYNDGSTTMDEHLTAELLKILAEKDSILADFLKKRGAYAIRGLLDKYGSDTFKDRLVLDRDFFTQMDKYSKWFSLPYPMAKGDKENVNSFYNLHHRALFTPNYRESYDGVCHILERRLTK